MQVMVIKTQGTVNEWEEWVKLVEFWQQNCWMQLTNNTGEEFVRSVKILSHGEW